MATDVDTRDSIATWHAQRHLKTDPGIREVYYLPTGAPPREIRFVEVNDLMPERDEDCLEPIDFGIDGGDSSAHRLVVLDLTPSQWDRIGRQELSLPDQWSLANAVRIRRPGHE